MQLRIPALAERLNFSVQAHLNLTNASRHVRFDRLPARPSHDNLRWYLRYPQHLHGAILRPIARARMNFVQRA